MVCITPASGHNHTITADMCTLKCLNKNEICLQSKCSCVSSKRLCEVFI